MEFRPQHLHHVYNRGNNQQTIFFSRENYFLFLKKMRNHLTKHSQILAYSLMSNHFHWLLFIDDGLEDSKNHPLNQQIGTLLSSYAQAINNRFDRTGSLFQQTTKSVELDSQIQARTCFHYIHQNPIRAGMVDKMGEWPYTSYPDYSGKRRGTLVAKEVAFNKLDIDPNKIVELSKATIDPKKIEKIY